MWVRSCSCWRGGRRRRKKRNEWLFESRRASCQQNARTKHFHFNTELLSRFDIASMQRTFQLTPPSSFCRIPARVQSIFALTLCLAFRQSRTGAQQELCATGVPSRKCPFAKLRCVYIRESGMARGEIQDLRMGPLTSPMAGSMLLCAIAVLVSAGLIWMSERKKAAVGRRLAYPQDIRRMFWERLEFFF